jgi:enoyl-CoA hydratase/carnithine racemase
MAENLERVFGMFDLDERVKAVVLTGAGKTFCAGADLEIGFGGGRERERTADHRDRLVLRRWNERFKC